MRWGRSYFAAQAIAGIAWWIAVFVSPTVRVATLGSLNPVLVALADIPLFVIASAVAAGGVKTAALVSSGWTCLVAVGLAAYATVTTEAGWGVLVMAGAAGASVVACSLVWLSRVPTEWIARGPFAFRPATMRTTVAVDVAVTFGQLVVFWGLFLVAIPGGITLLERRWELAVSLPSTASPIGVCLLVLASGLGVAAAVSMSTRGHGTPLPSAMPNRLVVVGPYRWIRNPMAVAGIAQGVAVGLILPSWLVIVYAIVGSVLWNYAVRPLEESDLEARFGKEFTDYRDAVRCWIPRVPPAKQSVE
jgi:protein-S-isoprenylcysteine O-methyltransferase Ste14